MVGRCLIGHRPVGSRAAISVRADRWLGPRLFTAAAEAGQAGVTGPRAVDQVGLSPTVRQQELPVPIRSTRAIRAMGAISTVTATA
jgi:hypothetical protein